MLGIGLAATRDLGSFFRYEKAGRAGHAESGRRPHHARDLRRQLAVGNVPRTLAAAGLQPGRARAHRLGRHEPAHRRAIHRSQSALRVSRRSRVAVRVRSRRPGVVDAVGRHGAQASGRELARSLPRDQHVPENRRNVRIGGSVGLASVVHARRHDAKKDIPLPDNVRRYYFPGVSHGGGPGGFCDIDESGEVGRRQLRAPDQPRARPHRCVRRSISRLVAWVTKNTPMPESKYPTLADGTLVKNTSAAMGFPAIPGAPIARRDSVSARRLRSRPAVPLHRSVGRG